MEFPLEEIYNVDTEVLYQEEVTPEVLQSFDEGMSIVARVLQDFLLMFMKLQLAYIITLI